MIRAVIYLFVAIILITFLRSVIGLIGKAFGGLFEDSTQVASQGRASNKAAGELKRDPVCGTYVAESASVKQVAGGEVIHFCSEACRDKYKGG